MISLSPDEVERRFALLGIPNRFSSLEKQSLSTTSLVEHRGRVFVFPTPERLVPSVVLRKLGIKPLTTQEFRLADGSAIRRKKGIALFKYQDKVGGADVIFGEEGDSLLLGTVHAGSAWPGTGPSAARTEAAPDDPRVRRHSLIKPHAAPQHAAPQHAARST